MARGPRYCDIILLDLDTSDNIFVVIENKLFSSNHPSQLEEYYELVEKNYKRAKIREYVYLTLYGIDPIQYDLGLIFVKTRIGANAQPAWLCATERNSACVYKF
jgi:hypothetical protein